jgi:hypothetical protein
MIRRSHELRYTLKNKETGDVYFVVVFTLLLKEDVEKEEAEAKQDSKASDKSEGDFKPSDEDLD